jgi:hypothetical protein
MAFVVHPRGMDAEGTEMTEKVKSKTNENIKPDTNKKSQGNELERELEDSFPASDPPSTTQPNTIGSPDHKGRK